MSTSISEEVEEENTLTSELSVSLNVAEDSFSFSIATLFEGKCLNGLMATSVEESFIDDKLLCISGN